MIIRRFLPLLLAAPILARASGPDSAFTPPEDATSPEAELVRSIADLRASKPDRALDRLDTVLQDKPDFHLARLIRGDMLAVRGGSLLQRFGNAISPIKAAPFREEAKVRVRHYMDDVWRTGYPEYFLEVPADINTAILVDIHRSRLFFYRRQNGGPWHLTYNWYTSSGRERGEKRTEGDARTPIGAYVAQGAFPKNKLSSFYGAGAYPLNYPNTWDRLQHRSGHGIWIHGSPTTTYSRPPRASGGCVVLTNPDFLTLSKVIEPGRTPVVVVDGAQWTSEHHFAAARKEFLNSLESWRQAWESRDMDRYFAWYSVNFRSSSSQDFASWEAQKRRVNAGKTYVQVTLSDIKAVIIPEKDPLVEVEFRQAYRSNNLSNNMRKRQYWRREDGKWRIIYEGDVK